MKKNEYQIMREQFQKKAYLEELKKDPRKLLNDVNEHAMKNYNKGWDVWIETGDDEEKLKVLQGAKTLKGGIRKAWNDIKHYVEYRNEVIETGK
jgi:hypothetical protein